MFNIMEQNYYLKIQMRPLDTKDEADLDLGYKGNSFTMTGEGAGSFAGRIMRDAKLEGKYAFCTAQEDEITVYVIDREALIVWEEQGK